MVKIMLAEIINALSAAILPISIGIVLFTDVEHADKQHLDTHHEHVMDTFLMTEFMAIMMLKGSMMEILPENVRSSIIVCTYLFPYCSKVERFYLLFFLPLPPHFSNELFKMFLPPNSRFNPIAYPSTKNHTHLRSLSKTPHGSSGMPTCSFVENIFYMAYIYPTLTNHHCSERLSPMESQMK
jgi:hypothetical protein